MKRKILISVFVIIAICIFSVLFCNILKSYFNDDLAQNNILFSEKVKNINTDKISLNEITEFDWDIMYTFSPYFPKEKMKKIIGFESKYIKETVSENMNQLIFIKDKKIICSIYGYGSNLGYYFYFDNYNNNFLNVKKQNNALFTVKKRNQTVILTYQSSILLSDK